MIFFNIAWMEKYNGETDADRPKDGGIWDEKNEVCNFANVDGRCFGFVYPINMGAINIERIGAEASAKQIDGVTVVWTAKHPHFGTVVVGWYRNATVYKDARQISGSPLHARNNVELFYAECDFDDATLLNVAQRKFQIPRGEGGMGQYLIWYADTKYGPKTKEKLSRFMEDADANLITEAIQISRMGEGLKSIGAFDADLDELFEDVDLIEQGEQSSSTKATLIEARVGQGKFRKNLDLMWNQSCALTGCAIREILRASHIKSWRDCANDRERLDPDNGLLLSAHIDALFDKHLISFEDDGSILISKRVGQIEIERLRLMGRLFKRLNDGQKRYLAVHRSHFHTKGR
jgi:HNH endonuclease